MSASTQLIADIQTVISNGPSTTTLANCNAAAGPIMDYKGNSALVLMKLQEADVLMNKIKGVTDSGDGNLTNINKILALLEGTSTPSTAALTDIDTIYTTAPATATKTNVNAPAGPIMDYPGNVFLVRQKLRETKVLVTALQGVTDNSTDGTNKTLLANMLLALV